MMKAMTSADVPAASAIDRNRINGLPLSLSLSLPPSPPPSPSPLFMRSGLIRNG